jgi:hypothetical protein
LSPTSLNIVDDQVAMKLACCFVSSISANLLIEVNVVNVFFACFLFFLSFPLFFKFCFVIFFYPLPFVAYCSNILLKSLQHGFENNPLTIFFHWSFL